MASADIFESRTKTRVGVVGFGEFEDTEELGACRDPIADPDAQGRLVDHRLVRSPAGGGRPRSSPRP
ncbi:hypothetical protein [Streptomyces sp. NPDC127119]|uniref:hypothetical protein n=1 Tax=Streptomyces sp. NPDC127119 TaxID=3345370 RepID=UPI0036300FD0